MSYTEFGGTIPISPASIGPPLSSNANPIIIISTPGTTSIIIQA